jgi:hypothetical protein
MGAIISHHSSDLPTVSEAIRCRDHLAVLTSGTKVVELPLCIAQHRWAMQVIGEWDA